MVRRWNDRGDGEYTSGYGSYIYYPMVNEQNQNIEDKHALHCLPAIHPSVAHHGLQYPVSTCTSKPSFSVSVDYQSLGPTIPRLLRSLLQESSLIDCEMRCLDRHTDTEISTENASLVQISSTTDTLQLTAGGMSWACYRAEPGQGQCATAMINTNLVL